MTFYVDGYEVGRAPLALKVPSGTYRVQAASAGHHGIPHDIAVDGVVGLQVDEDLERLIQTDFGPCLSSSATAGERATQFGHIGSLLGVQLVVGVRVDQTAEGMAYLAAEAFERESGRRRGGAAIKLTNGKFPAASLNGLWDLIGTYGAGDTRIRVTGTESSYLAVLPVQRSPSPPWMRPLAWISGGLALGMAGAAVYEGVSARNSYNKAATFLQPNGSISDRSAYNKFTNDGDSAKSATLVSAGVAVIFAGTAGVLGYMSREPGPPSIRF
jgi:hypothetical protein